MICIRSSTGRRTLPTRGQIAQAIPTGMPTRVERTIATAISARVVIALGHISELPFGPPFGICSTPNEAITAAENTAVRHEPTSQATSVAIASTPIHVSQWRSSTTQLVASLRKLPKPPTIVCRKKFELELFVTQLFRLSNQWGTPISHVD